MDITNVNDHTLNLTFNSNNNTQNKSSKSSTTIFCNPMNSNIQNRIMQKRNQARNQAKKVLMDQFKNHEKFDTAIDKFQEEASQKREEISEYEKQLKCCYDQKEKLKKEYGIKDDSQEQKDLLLLEKVTTQGINALNDDEKKRLLELDGVTEYQANVLEIDEDIRFYNDYISNAKNTIASLQEAAIKTRNASLKDNGMFFAQKSADAIIDAASDEIAAMAIQDSLQVISEKQKQDAEATENIKKQLGTTSENETRSDSSTNLVDKFNKFIKELQQKLKTLQQATSVAADDIKGLIVDQTV